MLHKSNNNNINRHKKANYDIENEMTPLTAKSLDDDENNEINSEETSLTNDVNTNFIDSSHNYSWSNDDFLSDSNEEDEKIYEDLCYVTFSSSLSDEVFIPITSNYFDCLGIGLFFA